jgi:hypothetical protein|uniref:Uncharacterized protein n=1 Tax=Desulfobacca acetoxidans TaxID=60893 RepID=A0A7C5AKL0_9BACT
MPDAYPSNSREAILWFHFADRLKSELLIASQLLASLTKLQGQELEGGKRIFLDYFRALEREIGLGTVIIGDQEMIRVLTVMKGLAGMIDSNLLSDIQQNLTWVISNMTTFAQRAMEYLLKEGLL